MYPVPYPTLVSLNENPSIGLPSEGSLDGAKRDKRNAHIIRPKLLLRYLGEVFKKRCTL